MADMSNKYENLSVDDMLRVMLADAKLAEFGEYARRVERGEEERSDEKDEAAAMAFINAIETYTEVFGGDYVAELLTDCMNDNNNECAVDMDNKNHEDISSVHDDCFNISTGRLDCSCSNCADDHCEDSCDVLEIILDDEDVDDDDTVTVKITGSKNVDFVTIYMKKEGEGCDSE